MPVDYRTIVAKSGVRLKGETMTPSNILSPWLGPTFMKVTSRSVQPFNHNLPVWPTSNRQLYR